MSCIQSTYVHYMSPMRLYDTMCMLQSYTFDLDNLVVKTVALLGVQNGVRYLHCQEFKTTRSSNLYEIMLEYKKT